MDFRHLIVTCLFSKLRLPFDNQKVKENYAILKINNENPTARRAFIFCLYCGLRFCDVKDLTFKNVDYAN